MTAEIERAIGRAMIAWGRLDQALHTDLLGLQFIEAIAVAMAADGHLEDYDQGSPKNLVPRLDRLGKKIRQIGKPEHATRLDALRSRILACTRTRGHLAHGAITPVDGHSARIFDMREHLLFREALESGVSRQERDRLVSQHLEIAYSIEQLDAFSQELVDIRDLLFDLISDVELWHVQGVDVGTGSSE